MQVLMEISGFPSTFTEGSPHVSLYFQLLRGSNNWKAQRWKMNSGSLSGNSRPGFLSATHGMLFEVRRSSLGGEG